MKYISVVIFLAFFMFNVFGQRFEGGINFGTAASQIDGDGYAGFNKLGYYVNAFSRYKVNNIFSIQAGVSLIQKGAHSPPKYAFFRTVINEVEVPFWVNVIPFSKLGATVGMNFGYIYKAYYQSSFVLTKEDLNIGNIDASFYLALLYKISKSLNFRIGFHYGILPITRPIRLDCWRNSIYMFWLSPTYSNQICWWTNTVTVTFELNLFRR